MPLAAVCARPPHPQPARVRLVIIRDTRTRLLDRFTLSQITVHAANRPPAAAATTAASHVIVGATRVRAPARAASSAPRALARGRRAAGGVIDASAGTSGTSADLEGVAATGAHTPVLVCCFLKCLFCGRPLGPSKAARDRLLSLMRRPFRSSSGAWLPLHTKDILTCVRAVPRFRAEPEVFRSSHWFIGTGYSAELSCCLIGGVDRVLRTQKPVVPPTHRVSKGLVYI